ncbi:hypothetical protein PR003_g5999 [Phytophthora rubi]|uniref:Uncharacterized protein n=1 Tax=Phytophthora rubi TaxID=129364 RepID=A0A6A3N3K2_9STRA|nr:hypothetical protein PR002_g6130 [Phytophthora rubi]KAE9041150.1 hypothetical protein PR001_g6755 [Phytophthora rubi]KAE9349216.1 hypothetical protein PR003_g5999 [Phytophthora rubi]
MSNGGTIDWLTKSLWVVGYVNPSQPLSVVIACAMWIEKLLL